MIVSPEVKCTICKHVFCCKRCRLNHEQCEHSHEIAIRKSCTICNGDPLIYSKDHNSSEMMQHVFQLHAPLYCKKCQKVFTSLDEIQQSVKCFQADSVCIVTTSTAASEAVVSTNSCIPAICVQTAVSKQIDNNVTDNLSSIRNISSINISSIINKSQYPNSTSRLVRTTSTPIINQLLIKIKETTFSSSSCYSAIYNQSSDILSDHTQLITTAETPSALMIVPSPRRQVGRKMPIGATPLRQVMSKSIQRAIKAQSLCNPTEPTNSASLMTKMAVTSQGHLTSPLDLRTTPSIKRSKSDGYAFQAVCKFTDKLTMQDSKDSISPSSLSLSYCNESVYETAQPITDCTNINDSVYNTPKLQSIQRNRKKLKKVASMQKKLLNDSTDSNEDDTDIWQTPMPLSENITSSAKRMKTPLTHEHTNLESQHQGGNRFFAIVSSVMQFASFAGTTAKSSGSKIIRRAASFTGYSGKVDDFHPYSNPIKRRRALTKQSEVTLSGSELVRQFSSGSASPAPKRPKRIEGRPPIDRMRKMS